MRDKLPFNTTLDPVVLGCIAWLAEREDPTHAAGNVPVTRLVREDIESRAPGLWDRIVAVSKESSSPTERVGLVLDTLREHAAGGAR